jgi:hypothetical protein
MDQRSRRMRDGGWARRAPTRAPSSTEETALAVEALRGGERAHVRGATRRGVAGGIGWDDGEWIDAGADRVLFRDSCGTR